TLRTLIESDPDLGWTKSDAELADALNNATIDVLASISTQALLAWAASNNRILRIRTAAADPESAVRNVAIAAEILITRDQAELDLNQPGHAGLVQALVDAGVLSAGEQT